MKKRQLKKYIAPKDRSYKGTIVFAKKFINTYLSGSEKEKCLRNLEIIRLLEEGIYILAIKVEFLATGKYNSEYSQNEDSERAIEYFQTINEIHPDDPKLYNLLDLALRIIKEKENKEQALKDLNKIRDVLIKYMADLSNFIYRLTYPPRWKK